MTFFKYFLPFFLMSDLCFADVNERFERIKSDPNALYAFFKEMPKGGELHFHLSGSAYPEAMLAIAAKGNYCLNQKNMAITSGDANCSGTKASELTKNPALYEQTIRAWSMKNFIPGIESGHDHFFATFFKFLMVAAENPIPLLADVMQRAANQHEQYMEIMIMPDKAKSATIANLPSTSANYAKWRQHLLNNSDFSAEIEKSIAAAESLIPATHKYFACDKVPKQAVCRLTVRFQYHILREQPLENFFPQALHAFAVASKSHAIVGVNLVQAEDGIISLRDYRRQMQIFAFLHQVYPDVRIALHAGELASTDVTPEDLRFHIHDAIKVGHAERIGHGVDIALEDNAESLVKDMAADSIAVEINLVSNKTILNISGRYHPLNYYLAHKVPVVLSTDDEGILRTDLTHQYVDAVLEHGLNYPTLKQINRNALTYSFLPGDSLWQDAVGAIMVEKCQDLYSNECQQFVAHSEKATLQRALELELIAFEKLY